MLSATQNIVFEILDERIRQFPLIKGSVASAGYDLRACIHETLLLAPGEVKLIGSGIKVAMPHNNMAAMLLPRSGQGHKLGLVLGNLVGLIDSDYTGELKISAWNRSAMQIRIDPLDRIAQLIFVPIIPTLMVEGKVDVNDGRGENGFNSSGTK